MVSFGPKLDQLLEVIKDGDDLKDHVLILKTDGEFELIEGAGPEVIKDLEYITRYETYDANSHYVGEDASRDVDYFEKYVMQRANQYWDEFLKTGNTRITNLDS